ncbi:hypothetical protein BDV93DRAFT_586550 [Ceratobasidium sp. AG-I]|nr:hypothetical protein BDV93DRAFT_586550 [Ceratobasidium sp. AG-I]
MSKSKSPTSQDIIAAAEAVYTILSENNIKACAIGSMAIAYTTKRPFGRVPNSLDFVTFQQGQNQRYLNQRLLTSHPDLFFAGNQSTAHPNLPPALFYKPQNSLWKIRVFFLPLWTRHSKENIPSLDYDEVVEPKGRYTVPVAPLPFLIYLQLHGWAWNHSLARQSPANKRANAKRDNFASDLGFLLPLAAKRRAHFDWLPDEFKERLKNSANDLVQEFPALCQDWSKMGVSGVEVKPKVVQPRKDKSAKSKHTQGEEKPVKGESRPIRGNAGRIKQIVDEQLELMELDQIYTGGLDFDS